MHVLHIFRVCHKHNSFSTGRIQTSYPCSKGLHALVYAQAKYTTTGSNYPHFGQPRRSAPFVIVSGERD